MKKEEHLTLKTTCSEGIRILRIKIKIMFDPSSRTIYR
jgi:hypothetical protein